jgi:hypothetical protein
MSFTTLLNGQLFILGTMTQNQILRLKLYSNDHTPSKTDNSGIYQEVIHPDYTTKLLSPSDWDYVIDDLTGNYTAVFAEQIWTFNSAVITYGYMITDNAGTTVLLAERFPNAPVMLDGSSGQRIKITPVLGAK